MSPIGISTLLSPLIQRIPLYKIERMKIAVDVNALLFVTSKHTIYSRIDKKFSLKEANSVLNHEAFEKAEYASQCIDMIGEAMKFLEDKFYCTFVFDGKSFPEKQLEMERRVSKSMGAHNTLVTMRNVFKRDSSNEEKARQYYNALFECVELNISEAPATLSKCIVGEYEADVTCAQLCKDKKVDAVLSSDYDALLFGCPYLIKDIDVIEGYADVITPQSIYDDLGINYLQFVDMCILMGTDYNEKISKVGPKTTLFEIRNHHKLENTRFYKETKLNINKLRKVYSSSYSEQKIKLFSLEMNEELNILGSPIKVL